MAISATIRLTRCCNIIICQFYICFESSLCVLNCDTTEERQRQKSTLQLRVKGKSWFMVGSFTIMVLQSTNLLFRKAFLVKLGFKGSIKFHKETWTEMCSTWKSMQIWLADRLNIKKRMSAWNGEKATMFLTSKGGVVLKHYSSKWFSTHQAIIMMTKNEK